MAIFVLLGALLADNAWTAIRNQRDLPHDDFYEMDDWFHVSSRDLEHVARENPRYTVSGRIAIYYFLEQRIGGKHLTIPEWWSWAKWELERVSHLEVEVAPEPMTVSGLRARRLRKQGEKREFQKGSRKRRRTFDFVLIVDPAADRYVMVDSEETTEIFVLPETQYLALRAGEAP